MAQLVDDLGKGARILKEAERVLVIGCSGGGKSTLSRALCSILDLPYVSMDRDFRWLPGWVAREKTQERAMIAETVARQRWLMDGTGNSTFDLRLPRAHLVIWVRMARWRCLWGICQRLWKHFGNTRPDMAPGCLEQLPDREFLTYIWTFETRTAPQVLDRLERFGADVPVLQLRTRREMSRLIELLSAIAQPQGITSV